MLRLGATPVCRRSSGTCATPARIAARGSPPARRRPSTSTVPAVWRRRPVSTSASSRWPLPATPAMPTTSPARTVSETSRSASTPRSPRAVSPRASSTTSPISAGSRRRPSSTSRPTISAASSRRVTSAVRTVATERPPRRTVTRSATAVTSWSLWEMKIDRAVLRRHRPERREEPLRLLRRQHRRRLVEDQDPRLAVERLEDLHPLLLADGELPDLRPRVDREPEAVAELGDRALDAPPVEQERAADVAVVAEDDVLRDGERLDEPEVLVHHPDPRVERVAGRRQDRPAGRRARARPRRGGRAP